MAILQTGDFARGFKAVNCDGISELACFARAFNRARSVEQFAALITACDLADEFISLLAEADKARAAAPPEGVVYCRVPAQLTHPRPR